MNKQEILSALNDKVKGHNKAKKCLMSLFERAKVRYYQKHGLEVPEDSDQLVTNKNILLVGKSGTGKTFLAEICAKLYKMPFMTIDATSLTQTSARDGLNLEDLLKRITDYATAFQANHKKDYFSVEGVKDQMIIFVDEFDKLGLCGDNDWEKKVQSNFLRFFENKIKGFKNLSFIFAGAFMGSDIYEKTVSKKPIGFFQSENPKVIDKSDLENKIIKAGILPEIVGRIHHIVKLDDLTKEDYRYILMNHLLPPKKEQILVLTGEELNISEESIDSIVEECYDNDQGVRLLSKKLEDLSLDLESDFDKYEFLRA